MRLLFDIGCNVGQWIESNLDDDTKIIGIDANYDIAKRTMKRFEYNDNVSIFVYVVGAEDEKWIKFYKELYNENSVVSTASEKWINDSRFTGTCKWDDPVELKSITIDEMIRRFGKPDFIKIDVEGYEYEALKGLTRAICPLCFEWAEESGDDIIHSIDHLHSLGYNKFFCNYGDDYTFRPDTWLDCLQIIGMMKNLIDGKKKNWGMIYADL